MTAPLPVSVSRTDMIAAFERLGIPDVTGIYAVRIGLRTIEVDRFTRNAEGRLFMAPDSDHVAYDTTVIPITN